MRLFSQNINTPCSFFPNWPGPAITLHLLITPLKLKLLKYSFIRISEDNLVAP